MTRRICSACGHTLVQPRAVDAVMVGHLVDHTAMHQRRGEACVWVVDATPEPARFAWATVVGIAAALILITVLTLLINPTSDRAYHACIEAFRIEVGAVTDADRADCRDGIADGK